MAFQATGANHESWYQFQDRFDRLPAKSAAKQHFAGQFTQRIKLILLETINQKQSHMKELDKYDTWKELQEREMLKWGGGELK